MLKGALVTLTVVVLATLLGWLALPYLTTELLTNQFASAGWVLHRLSLLRPTSTSWRWPQLQFSSPDQRTTITASNIDLRMALGDATGLTLAVDQLTITVDPGEEQHALDPASWLSYYRQALSLLPARGQIDKLELCLAAIPCFALQLVWRRQADGLLVTLQPQQAGIDQIHIRGDENGLQLDMFHAGARPLFVALVAAFKSNESIQLHGEILLVRDDWMEPIQQELALPQGLDLDWQTLNIRYHAVLLPESVDTAWMLLRNIRGQADLSWSGAWHWQGAAYSMHSGKPHSANLSMSADAWQLDLHPSYEVKLQLPDLPELQITTRGALQCQYHFKADSLGCAGGEVAITGPIGVQDLSVQLLIEQFELQDLLTATPVAGIDVGLQVSSPRQQWIEGRVRIDLADAEIKAVASALTVAEVPLNSFQLSYSINAMQGYLTTDYLGQITPFNQWLPGNFSGSVDLQLAVAWQAPLPDDWLAWPLSTELSIAASDLSVALKDNQLSGGQLQLKLSGWPLLTNPEPAHMSWRNIDVGVAVTALQMDFNVRGDVGSGHIDLEGISMSANTLGGSIVSDDFRFDLAEASGTAVIQLQQLELLQILSLEDEEFYSEGKLIGTIPVTIEQGNVIVKNGTVQTVAPGGLLQYNPSESVLKLAESNPQMATVLTTLKNFHYDSLDAELNFGRDGMLRMATSLKGHNPDYEQGREIHFNLTIEEDIMALLKSLQLSDRLTQQIENRMQ